jgi:methylase of polypeptide subunit release factors
MGEKTRFLWENLHKESRFRPKYPYELVVQYVFRNFKRDNKTKILDLGFSAGRHVYFMSKKNSDIYGIDISLDGVKYTKKF